MPSTGLSSSSTTTSSTSSTTTSPKLPQKRGPLPNDWPCLNPLCKASNYADRTSCFRCKTHKNDTNTPGVTTEVIRNPNKRDNNNNNNNNKKRKQNKKDETKFKGKKQKFVVNSDEEFDKEKMLDQMEPHKGSHAYNLFLSRKASKLAAETQGEEAELVGTVVKHPKRRLAVLVGFCGKNFSGMQMNEGSLTIQGELERAFFECDMITLENYGFIQKQSWSNSARTDKGVHAAAQVISLKAAITTPDENLDKLRENINAKLPNDIRVLDIVKAVRNFSAKTSRDKVRYQYMIPSYVLQEKGDLVKTFDEYIRTSGVESSSSSTNYTSFSILTDEDREKLNKEFAKFRCAPDTQQKLQQALTNYVGTKKYHNFTSSLTSSDPSCKRYMMSFDVLKEPIIASDNMEWIAVAVTGQSFLLHQIRKMVSVAIDATRGAITDDKMLQLFSDDKLKTSIAPAQGLFLDMSFFERYSNKNSHLEPLDWHNEETPAKTRWADFKREKIINHMLDEESLEHNFLKYIYEHDGLFFREDSAYEVCEVEADGITYKKTDEEKRKEKELWGVKEE